MPFALKKVSASVALILSTAGLSSVTVANSPTDYTKRVIVNSEADKDTLMQMATDMAQTMGVTISYERQMGLPNTHLLTIASDSDELIGALASQLHDHGMTEWAERDALMQPFFTPNDPFYEQQWQYFDPIGGINAEPAWDLATGKDTVIAVIDTGILPHIDLQNNTLPGYDMISIPAIAADGDARDNDATDTGDFVTAGFCGNGLPRQDTTSSWHGTHVAGTAAAIANDNAGVAGVAFDAKIVPIRAMGKCGGTTADVADSILWAAGVPVQGTTPNANKADVINLSLGGEDPCGNLTQQAINMARQQGAVVVVASGNSQANVALYSPGNCNGVISVAATGRSGARASYSNFGDLIDLTGPGGDAGDLILSSDNLGQTVAGDDALGRKAGTSMAAPHVAGVAALLKGIKPEMTPDEVETVLKQTAKPFVANCVMCGDGMVDAQMAVQAVFKVETKPAATLDNLGVATGKEAIIDKTFIINAINNGPFNEKELSVRFSTIPAGATININNEEITENDTISYANINRFSISTNNTLQDGAMLTWRFEKAGVALSDDINSPMTISRSNVKPELIEAIDDLSIAVNDNVFINLSNHFSDGDNDPLVYEASGLPQGLVVRRGFLTGKTSDTGDFQVNLSASDGVESISNSFQIKVGIANNGSQSNGSTGDGSGNSNTNQAITASGSLGLSLLSLPLALFFRRRPRR